MIYLSAMDGQAGLQLPLVNLSFLSNYLHYFRVAHSPLQKVQLSENTSENSQESFHDTKHIITRLECKHLTLREYAQACRLLPDPPFSVIHHYALQTQTDFKFCKIQNVPLESPDSAAVLQFPEVLGESNGS